MNTAPVTGATTFARVEPPDSKVADAASQFEALLLTEMLKCARGAGSGDWMGVSEDDSGSSLAEMAQEQFAQALARSGGLGFSKMVTDQFAHRPQFKVGNPNGA